VDPLWLVYGAIAGAVVGVAWGRFHPDKHAARPGIRESIVFAVAIVANLALTWLLPPHLLPTSFWLTALVVGWFVEPIGERYRSPS